MTDRPIRIIENAALALTGLVIAAALIFPVYSSPDLGILYKTAIAAAGFLFIARVKLLNTEDRIETPIDAQLFLLFIWYIISVIMARDKFTSMNAAVAFLCRLQPGQEIFQVFRLFPCRARVPAVPLRALPVFFRF
jgi:hypothetical protein